MDKKDKIYIAGHTGLVGSAIVKQLTKQGYSNLVMRSSKELDLTQQQAVHDFFACEKPQYVFLCAARVGGILANKTYPAPFIYQNLMIQSHVIHHSMLNGVKRLLFLGSSCIYPRDCPQPIKEEYLLSGSLEFTNRPYAVAKIAGIEMCWAYNRQYGTRYLCAMPTNLYGPNDNYDLETSHVLPALIRRMHEAKVEGKATISLWGTGKVHREFLYSEDMADAALFLMSLSETVYDKLLASPSHPPLMNVGSGQDLTIKELALLVADIIGFQGNIEWNPQQPDGTPRKLLDVSALSQIGWKATTSLPEGIRLSYQSLEKSKIIEPCSRVLSGRTE